VFVLAGLLIMLVCGIHIFNLQGPQLSWANFSYIIGDTRLLNFAMGTVAYLIFDSSKNKICLSASLVVVISVLLLLITMAMIHLKFPKFISNSIPAFLLLLVFLFMDSFALVRKWTKSIVFVGDASYSIYLTHFYFAFFKFKILFLMDKMIVDKVLLINIVDAILFSGSMVFGCCFYLLVEKPITSYFSKMTKTLVLRSR
jgi:peptidoglycan/LPS O-acetylase OafA/YrhL